MAIFPKNDELKGFLKAGGYPTGYNDGFRQYLIDITGKNESSSMNDLVNAWNISNGGILGPGQGNAIKALFAPGDSGAWFSSADVSLLWADTTKTINVVDGDPIAVQDSVDLGTALRHTREQITLALRPVYRVRADGVGFIDYASGKTWSIPGSSSTMKYMHDGTGGSLIMFLQKQQDAAGELVRSGGGTSRVGFRFRSSDSQNLSANIYRGVVGTDAVFDGMLNTFTSAPRTMFASTYKDRPTGNVINLYSNSSKVASGTSRLGAPATGNSQIDILWDTTGGHEEYHSIFINRELSSEECGFAYATLGPIVNAPIPKNIDYGILLLGQSNQSGRGDISNTLPAETTQDGVYMYSKGEELRLATAPEHSLSNALTLTLPREALSTPAHGTSIRVAKQVNSSSGSTFLLIPLAVGGTSIAQWNTPLTISDPTTLFGFMKKNYEAVKSRFTTPVIFFVGHEADAADIVIDLVNGNVGTVYQDRMVDYYNNIVTHITDGVEPIIIQVQLPGRDSINSANSIVSGASAQLQLENIIPNFHVVASFDMSKEDGAHYDRTSVGLLGDRMALAFRQHVLGESVNGTGPRLVSAIQTSTTVITLTFDSIIAPLGASPANYSDLFNVYEEGVVQTITSAVRGTPTTTIDITVSAAITGNVTVSYGYIVIAQTPALTEFVRDLDDMPLPLFGPISVSPL